MENNKILSVSVAAYNLEGLIREALDSYVAVSNRELLEVLVTDDGSKDSTPAIVEEYAEKYPGVIKLIRQKNAGPGSTVNSGIKHATGKYFRMIDGDDKVDSAEMEAYLNFLKDNDADAVVTNYTEFISETGSTKPFVITGYEQNKVLRFEDVCENLLLNMHAVTFKTEIMQKNSITLDNCFYTDVEYLLLPMQYVNTIAFLPYNIYLYRVAQQEQSMSLKSLQNHFDMHTKVLYRLLEYSKTDFGEKRSLFIRRRISEMCGTQLFILLSFDASAENKQKIREFNGYVEKNYPEVYKMYGKKRSVMLLKATGYAAYGLLHKKVAKSGGVF